MILGQFTSKGSMKAVEVVPLLKGVGWGQQIASGFIATYYSAIIAWTLSYVYNSFSETLPWSNCESEYGNCLPAEALDPLADNSTGMKSSAEWYLK